MKVHSDIKGTEYWYDAQCRCWFGAKIDKEHNLSSIINTYKKEDIIKALKHTFGEERI